MKHKAEFAAGVSLGLYEAAFSQPPLFVLFVSAFMPRRVATALQTYVVLNTIDRLVAQHYLHNREVITEPKG